MSLIPYPNVPNVPGVPALLRSATVLSVGSLALAGISYLSEAIFGAEIWGVYDQKGNKVLEPDSFLDVDFRNNSNVSNYPQEKGAFGTYNKVNTPYYCRVRMAIGADLPARTAFIEKCGSMLNSTELFSVVTPEKTYLNVTLHNHGYRREEKSGRSMLTIDLWFLEVRENETRATVVPKQASGFPMISGGQVQAAVSDALASIRSSLVIQ